MQTVTKLTKSDTMYYRSLPVLTYSISYPRFQTTCSPSAEKSINWHYSSLAAKEEHYCRTELFHQASELAQYRGSTPDSFIGYEWKSDFQITFNRNCVTSLYLDHYHFMGGAHGETMRSSDTWSFATGRRMLLTDFIQTESLPSLLEKEVARRLTEVPGSYFDNYPSLIRQTFRPENFYLTEKGPVIFFQQYDIAPYATGIVTIPIHRKWSYRPGP